MRHRREQHKQPRYLVKGRIKNPSNPLQKLMLISRTAMPVHSVLASSMNRPAGHVSTPEVTQPRLFEIPKRLDVVVAEQLVLRDGSRRDRGLEQVHIQDLRCRQSPLG